MKRKIAMLMAAMATSAALATSYTWTGGGALFGYKFIATTTGDVTIKNNRVGQIVEGLVVNNWFTQTMLDWTEAYYSKSQSVLNDR